MTGHSLKETRICPVCTTRPCVHFLTIDERAYWRCRHCEATFVDPAQRPRRSVEFAAYQLHRNEVYDPAYRRFRARLTSPLLARLPAGSSGLDYGCGRCEIPCENVALLEKPQC